VLEHIDFVATKLVSLPQQFLADVVPDGDAVKGITWTNYVHAECVTLRK